MPAGGGRGERRIVAPNITPDRETGAGNWTDDMLARAIREGIGHDDRALFPGMWYESFAMLSYEDLAAVIVYLRSIPAARPCSRSCTTLAMWGPRDTAPSAASRIRSASTTAS
jgi:hypothetical protein